jgi:hypothetical protein
VTYESGKCRVCGCTDLKPCAIGGGHGNPVEFCWWLDIEHTLCSNPRCIAVTPVSVLEKIVVVIP